VFNVLFVRYSLTKNNLNNTNNEKLFYKNLIDNKTQTNNGTPNINEIKEFWSNIWSNEVCSINHGCSTKAPRTTPFEALPSPARINSLGPYHHYQLRAVEACRTIPSQAIKGMRAWTIIHYRDGNIEMKIFDVVIIRLSLKKVSIFDTS
jgi:hypothetical protein